MVKRFRKIFLVFLALTIILIGSAWALLIIYHDDIRLKVEENLDKQVDALVTFEDLTVSFLKDFPNLTVTLHELSVVGKGQFAGDTLAIADEIDFEVKTQSLLFSKATEVSSLHIKKPHLFFRVLENGKTNFNIFPTDSVQAAGGPAPSGSVNVALAREQISDGTIEYLDEASETFILLTNVDHTGLGNLKQDLFDLTTITNIGELSLDRGKVRILSRKEVEVALILQANVKERTITLRDNRVRINHFTLELQGSMAQAEDGFELDLSFSSPETDFKNIISLVPGIFMEDFKRITTKGELGFKGFIIGKYSPNSHQMPTLMLNIKVENALFKIDTLPDPIENIQMNLVISNLHGHMDSTVYDFKSFQFDLRQHQVRGSLKFQGYEHFKIDTDIIANADLAELERMYPIKGIELKGNTDFELKAKGPISFRDGKLHRIPSFHLDLKLKGGRLKYDSLPAAIENIQFHLLADNATGELEKSVFDFRGIHMDLENNIVHGFVKVQGFEDVKINADLLADINLADMERMFPIEGTTLKGKLMLDVVANGIYNKEKKKFPSLDAHIELTDGYIKTKGYPEPLENLHLSGEAVNTSGNFADTKLTIKNLTYSLEDEVFEIQGEVTNLDHFDYKLKVKGIVDLAKLTKIYPMNGMKLTGIITSDFSTRGSLTDVEAGFYEKIRSRGKVEVKNLSVEMPSIKNKLIVYNANYTFSSKKIILEKCEGKFGRSRFSMTGDLFNYMAFMTKNNTVIKGDLNLKCDTLDVNEWLGEPVTTTTQSKNDSVTTKIKVWQVPLNLEAVFDSEIGLVLYDDIRISKLDGEIRIKDGKMTLHETGFNTLNAAFSLSGGYDTRDIRHPLFNMDLEIKELDIQRAYKEMKLVRELLPSAANADGSFSISYKLKGELNDELYPKMETLSGGGEMRIANAKINGMKIFEELSKAAKRKEVNDPHLKDFVMNTEIRDNKIIVKPFSVRVGGYNADVEGVSEINGAIRYLVKIQLVGIKIPFNITGTYDNPKVALGKGHVLLPSDSLSN